MSFGFACAFEVNVAIISVHPCSVKILEFQMVEQALKDEIKFAKKDLAKAKKELEECRAKRHRTT